MTEKTAGSGDGKVKFHVFPDERFVDLNLYQFGWERCAPLHSYGPFARNHFLFHYVIAGRGTLVSNDHSGQGHEYALHAGQGFLICPGQVNTYYADERTPWEYTWLEFDGMRVKEALDQAGLDVDHPVFHSMRRELSQQVRDTMLYIVDHAEASSLALTGQGFLFLDRLVEASANRKEAGSKKLRDFYLKEAMNFIEQNYQNDISVEDIAAHCGLNRSYFGRIFRDTVGQSPQEFLLSYRMSKAAQLLKTTNLTIQEVSHRVGYANPLHFSRAFKGVYSLSPRDWRNRHLML